MQTLKRFMLPLALAAAALAAAVPGLVKLSHMSPPLPSGYEQWPHRIEGECGRRINTATSFVREDGKSHVVVYQVYERVYGYDIQAPGDNRPVFWARYNGIWHTVPANPDQQMPDYRRVVLIFGAMTEAVGEERATSAWNACGREPGALSIPQMRESLATMF